MAVAFVNSVAANNSASDTSLAAAATSLTTGNLIVGAIGWDSTVTTVTGVTDTAGNTYTIGTRVNYGSFADSYVTPFWCISATGNASNIVTVTLGAAATFRRLVTVQYSGLGSGTKVDEQADATTAAVNARVTYTTPSLTLGGSGVLVGIAAPYSSVTMAPGGSATERVETGADIGALDFITSSNGTLSVDFAASTTAALIGLAFLEASSPPQFFQFNTQHLYHARR